MAAPSPLARETPDGIPLRDGYSTKITLAVDPDISFWEKTVKAPMLDGGDPIDHTTMHNVLHRTSRPRSLVTTGPINLSAEWDPDVYDEILAVINVETTITVTFADGSTLAAYGYLRSFDPQEVGEGDTPVANIVIEITNYDSVAHAETGWALEEIAGT